jgi:hypothetical protein
VLPELLAEVPVPVPLDELLEPPDEVPLPDVLPEPVVRMPVGEALAFVAVPGGALRVASCTNSSEPQFVSPPALQPPAGAVACSTSVCCPGPTVRADVGSTVVPGSRGGEVTATEPSMMKLNVSREH